MIGGNLVFGMGDGEITNQHPVQEILQEILWEILRDTGGGEKDYLRKAVIGGNLGIWSRVIRS